MTRSHWPSSLHYRKTYGFREQSQFLTLRPYWRYKHADWVANPRLQHVGWNNLTLLHDHPFWQTHFPPNGWGCSCRIIAVDAREYEKSRASGQTEPPAGWNEIDPKTGTPKGIAKGFDYAPGASVADAAKLAKPAFVEAKTAKAAAEWAVKNNLADYADYTGIKPEVANAWNKSLFDHLQEFPELRKNQKFVGTCQAQFSRWREIEIQRYIEALRRANPHLPPDFDFTPHAERAVKAKKVDAAARAHAWKQEDVGGIAVNKRWGADVDGFKASLPSSVSAKWNPVGCDTIKSVADHEMGHMLDYQLDLRPGQLHQNDNDIVVDPMK